MAYISDKVSEQYAAGTNFVVTRMPTHQSGDVLIAWFAQDNGTGTLAASGWTQIGTQAIAQDQRTAVWRKTAASSNETITVTSTVSAVGNLVVATCKGVDTSNPVDGENRVDTGLTATPASASLTTTNNNCLLLYAWGFDGTGILVANPADLTNIGKEKQAVQLIVGWKNQDTAGAIPSISAVNEVTTEGGTSIVVALKDDGTNQKAPEIAGYTLFRRYGAHGQILNASNTAFTGKNMSGTAITSINGSNIASTNPTAVSNFTNAGSGYGQCTRFTWTAAPGAGVNAIYGSYETITATDFRGKIVSLQWAQFAVSTASLAVMGPQGTMLGFQDSSNNWAVFQLSPSDGILAQVAYVTFIDVENQTPLASGGTIDWSQITKVIVCHERTGSIATQHGTIFKDLILHDKNIITGGSPKAPANPGLLKNAMEGWGQYNVMPALSERQVLNRSSYQIGDGTKQTYHKSSIVSYDLPAPYSASFDRRFWQVPALNVEYRIKASSADTIDLSASLVASQSKQTFIIDPASDTSATYNFAGLGISGYVVTAKLGIDFDSTTFNGCYEINLNDTGMLNCIVANSLAPAAVITGDVEQISNTQFSSGGTGHAIEAQDTGTFDFTGNSFTGYGANNTTDAAFYNNSGGLITLELAAGDVAPTVRNGTGASTVINLPNRQSVTISGAVAGSRIQIYDLTSNTELYNGTPTFPYTWTDTDPYVTDREIRIRRSYVTPSTALVFIDTVIGTATATNLDLEYRLNPETDTVYVANGIDGSIVTDITVNDVDARFDLEDSKTCAEIYAYAMYTLFTEDGIRDLGQTIFAVDQANYRVDGRTIKNTSSPSIPVSITDGWLVDASTGKSYDLIDDTGGTLFMAPDHVVPFSSVGTPVITGDIADVPTAGENATAVASALNTDLTTIKNQTDTLESGQATMQGDITTIKNQTDTLESSATTIINATDTLEASATTIVNATDTLEASAATIVGQTDTLESGQAAIAADVTTIKNNTDTLETDMGLIKKFVKLIFYGQK